MNAFSSVDWSVRSVAVFFALEGEQEVVGDDDVLR